MRRRPPTLLPSIQTVMSRGLLVVLLALPGTAGAATLTVDCNAGGKIQAAVDTAKAGDVIQVSGFCNENVRFNDEVSRITLDGKGSATIHGPSATVNTITIRGRGITIAGFTVTGGRNGIAVLVGATATIQGNTIRDAAENGINVAQHGYARIIGNTIESNPEAGIRVLETSSARIGFLDLADVAPNGNVIRNNGDIGGVLVERSAGASLVGNAITQNAGPGVSVSTGSHADLAGNHIDGNGSDAIVVDGNSVVQLGDEPGILAAPNDTTQPNAGVGLRCARNSSASGTLGTVTGLEGDRGFDSSCSNGPKIK